LTTTSIAFIARWVARAWSVLNILIIFLFAIGQSLRPLGPVPTYKEWIGLALWPVGVAIGLLVAWLREVLGGIVTLACLVAFYIWTLLRSGNLPHGPFFFLIASPALVFILAGVVSRRGATHPASSRNSLLADRGPTGVRRVSVTPGNADRFEAHHSRDLL
jgi:hypothetical protein